MQLQLKGWEPSGTWRGCPWWMLWHVGWMLWHVLMCAWPEIAGSGLLTAAAKSDFQESPRVWRHTNAAHSTDDTADPNRGDAKLHIIERHTLSTVTSSQAPNS